MKILITGGTGLIGTVLTQALCQNKNNEIVVLSRCNTTGNKSFGRSVEYVKKLHQELVNRSDIVINLAGEPIAKNRWSTSQKQEICQSRWHLTKKLVELIKQSPTPPKTFISGSAIGIYGRQTALNIDEDYTQFHAEFSNELCQTWEEIAAEAQSKTTRVCILRTGIVLSPNDGALKQMLLPFKLGFGGKMASGNQMMSWIHIKDMIDGIIYIINNETITGPINMTSPLPVTNTDFSRTLAKTLSRPCILSTPKLMLTIIFGEMADLFVYGQHVIPKKLTSHGYEFSYPKLEDALTNLLIE